MFFETTILNIFKFFQVMKLGEERMGNIKTVKIFSKEKYENKIFSEQLEHAIQIGYRESQARAIFYGMTGMSGNIIIMSVLYYGGQLVRRADQLHTLRGLHGNFHRRPEQLLHGTEQRRRKRFQDLGNYRQEAADSDLRRVDSVAGTSRRNFLQKCFFQLSVEARCDRDQGTEPECGARNNSGHRRQVWKRKIFDRFAAYATL